MFLWEPLVASISEFPKPHSTSVSNSLLSAAIIGREAATATIPHLKAAENGGTVVVQFIDNNFFRRVANIITGTFNVFLAPIRALLGVVGLRF